MECTSAKILPWPGSGSRAGVSEDYQDTRNPLPKPRLLVYGQQAPSLQEKLVELGYDAACAFGSLEESFIKILRDPPDLIVIDIDKSNPDPDIRLAEAVRDFHNLALSYSSDGDTVWAMPPGYPVDPFNFVVKPQDSKSLNACVRLCLARRQTPDSGSDAGGPASGAMPLPQVLALI